MLLYYNEFLIRCKWILSNAGGGVLGGGLG